MTPSNHAIPPEVHAGVQRLVHFYEHLEKATLDDIHHCYAPLAHFKDPFNDVQGLENIRQVFAHMFTTVDEPRFVVTETLIQGQKAFLAWEFHFRMRRWRKGIQQCIRGGTFLRLDAQGMVLEHRDYWDAAEELYEKLPVIGRLMRRLRHAGAASVMRRSVN